MSDLIKGMFADKLKEWGMSAARGINPTGVVGGTVDLINLIPRGVNAALGLGYEEQLSKPFLGTGWMEDRGLLQKEQPGLDNTIVEMGAGMLGGGGALRLSLIHI